MVDSHWRVSIQLLIASDGWIVPLGLLLFSSFLFFLFISLMTACWSSMQLLDSEWFPVYDKYSGAFCWNLLHYLALLTDQLNAAFTFCVYTEKEDNHLCSLKKSYVRNCFHNLPLESPTGEKKTLFWKVYYKKAICIKGAVSCFTSHFVTVTLLSFTFQASVYERQNRIGWVG